MITGELTDVRQHSVSARRDAARSVVVLLGLMLAILLAMLDNMIVGTAMPRIVGELGGLDHLSWVVTAYVLGTTVSTPIWGKLGDLYGRKGIFLTSIVDLPGRLRALHVRLDAGAERHDRSSSASGPCRASAPVA